MVDVISHEKYELGDIIAFLPKALSPSIQIQGRILSMWKNNEKDENCIFTVGIVRRPFIDTPSDYIAQTHLIYEYWDTNEYCCVLEEEIVKLIPSATISKEKLTVDYFLDTFENDDLKNGIIHVSGYHDNVEGALFEVVSPELLLSSYHFDYESEDYGNPREWPVAFLLTLKKFIFDPFVSSLSKKISTGNFDLWVFLLNQRKSDVPILDKLSTRSGKEMIRVNRMYHPTICIPVIDRLIKQFYETDGQSVAVVIEKFEDWSGKKGDVGKALIEIARLEQKNEPDPMYADEMDLVDAVSLSSFIEKDETDDSSLDESEGDDIKNPFSEDSESEEDIQKYKTSKGVITEDTDEETEEEEEEEEDMETESGYTSSSSSLFSDDNTTKKRRKTGN